MLKMFSISQPDVFLFKPTSTLTYIDHYYGGKGQTYAQKVHVVAQGFNMSDLELIGILLGQQQLNERSVSIKAVEWQRCGQPHIHALMLITAENMYMLRQASIH